MSESIEYQRGEPFRLIRVFRESSDGGTTWTRLPLTGRHYARDIRSRNSETATLLLLAGAGTGYVEFAQVAIRDLTAAGLA